jgi:acetyl esterase/lipase
VAGGAGGIRTLDTGEPYTGFRVWCANDALRWKPRVVHGGGWTGGTPSNANSLAPRFAVWGSKLETATYRFIPAVTMADEVSDVSAEISRVRGGSLEPLIVVGHSAGAQLAAAAVLGADDGKPTCLVLLDGAGLDLPKMLTDLPTLQVKLGLTPEQALALSPMALIDSGDNVQVFVAASDLSHTSQLLSTRATGEAFATELQQLGLRAEFHYYPGVAHMDFVTFFSQSSSAWAADVHRFLQGCAGGTSIK